MSTQFHYAPRRVPVMDDAHAQCLWSINPAGQAIVFVHGFGGNATGTWNEFGLLLPQQAACAGCDLIFYGYDGLYTQANISAGQFEGFLNQLFTNPIGLVNGSLPNKLHRQPPFEYKWILLVAHSLGAIVCRRAILNARKQGRTWVDRTSMVLFAPAHLGVTNVTELGSEVLSTIPFVGGILATFWKFQYQALQDLEQGSQTLTQLLADTQAALAAGPVPCLIPRRVLIGSKEKIVVTGGFGSDPVEELIPGKDHLQVCKPNGTYSIPVARVLEALA